jgi:L-threonylcarbamoyladenylate synthase
MLHNLRLKRAIAALDSGGVIAYPTESIYGVGCDPWDDNALSKILTIKQRPWEKGLIVIAADFNQLQEFIQPLSTDILQQLEATWPGPVTWLLPVKEGVSPLLIGEHDAIAVRVTAHPVARSLCEAYGGPIVSTSANLSGRAPAKQAYQVRQQLPEVDYILTGRLGGADKPSQIRDARTGKVLR